MMEMDRLVVVLDGSEDQTLVIESKNSHVTMKDVEDGLEKYIQNRRISAFVPFILSFCGVVKFREDWGALFHIVMTNAVNALK